MTEKRVVPTVQCNPYNVIHIFILVFNSSILFFAVKQQVCNGPRIRNITKRLKTQLRSLSLCLNENMPIVLPLI